MITSLFPYSQKNVWKPVCEIWPTVLDHYNINSMFWYTIINLSTCCTLRSWYRSVSLWLEDNDTLKCQSNNFAKTLRYLVILENWRNYISMYHYPPIAERSSKITLKFYPTRDRILMAFRTFPTSLFHFWTHHSALPKNWHSLKKIPWLKSQLFTHNQPPVQ